jgi:hypothetical protein
VESGQGVVSQAQGQQTLGTQTLERDAAGGGLGGSLEVDVEARQCAGNNYGVGSQSLFLYGDQSGSVGGDGDYGKVTSTLYADTYQVQEIN